MQEGKEAKDGRMTMRRRIGVTKTSNDVGLLPSPGDDDRGIFDRRPTIGRNVTYLALVVVLAACATSRAPTSEELYDADIRKCDALAPPFDPTKTGDPDYLSQMNEAFSRQQKCYYQANVNLEGRDQKPASNLKTLQEIGAGLEPTEQRMMPAIAPSPQSSPAPTMSTP
jgi:hypothetical protein